MPLTQRNSLLNIKLKNYTLAPVVKLYKVRGLTGAGGVVVVVAGFPATAVVDAAGTVVVTGVVAAL